MTNMNRENRLPLADIVKRIIGHEAALATDTPKFEVHWDREWPLLDKLMASARSGTLKIYERGTFQSIAPGKLPPPTLLMTREAYLSDVDAWLDLHEPHTPFRFHPAEQGLIEHDRNPIYPGNSVMTNLKTTASSNVVQHSTKGRRTNVLTAEIERAVEQVGNTDTSAVLHHLRERADNQAGPFTGVMPNGSLKYTDDYGQPKTLSRDALGQRLKRR
jgi:hypothetical protein